jgi:sugar lactone lactonase YvrE
MIVVAVLLALIAGTAEAEKRKKKKDKKVERSYAEYVWPPPPDEAKIQLVDVITERADVEAKSGLMKGLLLGATKADQYKRLKQPFDVAIDSKRRFVVSDPALGAVLRFDRDQRIMDVLGTSGAVSLKTPLGVCISDDDTIFVADPGSGGVLAFDEAGKLLAIYGKGELRNPTDMAISPSGTQLYVADSMAHRIAVFAIEEKKLDFVFGQRGTGEGEYNFPSALAFDQDGNLMVVDQGNARVQVVTAEGEYLDHFGERGTGFGQFTRPKSIEQHRSGIIFVTDGAFNNIQVFDIDYQLLTFVGEGGEGPGQFLGASGIAVVGDVIAVVDQLGRRLQVLHFLPEE